MDELLFRFINSGIKNPFLDRVLPVFSDKDFITIPAIIGIACLCFLGSRKTRVVVLSAFVAVLLADYTSEKILKELFNIPRPYMLWEQVHQFRSGRWLYDLPSQFLYARETNAFPSTHAANIAAATAGLAFISLGTLWLMVPLSLMVGFSRIYLGQHTPLQVTCGYIWGALVGFVVITAASRALRHYYTRPLVKPTSRTFENKAFLLILGAWAFVNFSFVFLSNYCLSGDEAQYWDWSRRLALGYYSKPPLVAYVIRELTQIAGNKEWVIRSGAVMFSCGTIALLYGLTRRIAGSERAGLAAALIAICMPATWVGSVVMTVDPLLIFFWTLAMYSFYRATKGEKAQWLLAGFALGMAGLSKYTVFLLVLSLAVYLLLADRQWLKTPWPYAALLIMAACFSGVIYWNAANDWVSVRHTASIGAGDSWTLPRSLSHIGEFIGSQFLVASPILFLFFGWAAAWLIRMARNEKDAAFLLACFGAIFVFYAAVSVVRKPLPNWPVAAYIALVPALAWICERRSISLKWKRWLMAAGIVGCVMGMAPRASDLVYLAAMPFTGPGTSPERINLGPLSIDPDKDPTNELYGGHEIGQALSRHLHEAPESEQPFIFAPRYQLTAWAAFYTRSRPRTYCLNYDRRYNQYDLWGGWDKLAGRDALFITGGDAVRAQAYIDGMVGAGAFSSGELLDVIECYRGKTLVRSFTVSRLRKYSGIQATPSAEKF